MKKILFFIGLAFVSVFSSAAGDEIKKTVVQDSLFTNVEASPIKIGYINKEDVLSAMPQVEAIEKELLQLEKDYEGEFVNMTKEYERKVKSYLEHNKQMSEPIKLAKQTEITELESRMSMYKKRYKEEIAKRKDDKFKPLKEQIDKVIKDVCVEEKITILFDSTQPLYVSSQCVDLTLMVKAKLGL